MMDEQPEQPRRKKPHREAPSKTPLELSLLAGHEDRDEAMVFETGPNFLLRGVSERQRVSIATVPSDDETEVRMLIYEEFIIEAELSNRTDRADALKTRKGFLLSREQMNAMIVLAQQQHVPAMEPEPELILDGGWYRLTLRHGSTESSYSASSFRGAWKPIGAIVRAIIDLAAEHGCRVKCEPELVPG